MKKDQGVVAVMRPNGDMTPGQDRTPKKDWFEGKVRELGDAIDALPEDRADLARELLEDVPLFSDDEMTNPRSGHQGGGR